MKLTRQQKSEAAKARFLEIFGELEAAVAQIRDLLDSDPDWPLLKHADALGKIAKSMRHAAGNHFLEHDLLLDERARQKKREAA